MSNLMLDKKQEKQVFNIEVPIPDDLILISKVEYVELLNQNDRGQWWTIDKVVDLLGMSKSKLVNTILLNPKWKQEIDIGLNPEGFVVYPETKGQPYRFLATKTREYFQTHFASILLD